MFPIFFYTGELFKAIKMDEEASELAGKYVVSVLPGLFMQGMLDIDRNFLTSFEASSIAMKC